MTIHAYLFEVRAIQPFLFASGKLKDMVAGSEIIDYLCRGPLAAALRACNLHNPQESGKSPRCAGGVFYLLIENREQAEQFRRLWTMLVAQLLPGIEQVDALTSAASPRDAIAAGLADLRIARNMRQPRLPAASPLALRAPRTGEVAIAWDNDEPIDAATHSKRNFRRPAASIPLTQRFCATPALKWPDNFEATSARDRRFPLGDNNLVALIHADGNGLGEILRILDIASKQATDQDYVTLYRSFSDGLEQAICAATQHACDGVLVPAAVQHVMPARPLVMGGDDLTLLVRADLALPFTVGFLRQFEQHTEHFLDQLRAQMQTMGLGPAVVNQLPTRLTACAGITYMKSSQPFAQCYELTESLCGRAKEASRRQRQSDAGEMPSSLAFHKLQASQIDDAAALFELELTVKETGLALAMPVYGIDTGSNLPLLDDLSALANSFGPTRLNEKRLRSIATLLHTDPLLASKDYKRWRELASRNPVQAQYLDAFDQCLHRLLGDVSDELPADFSRQNSPLADLLTYLSIHSNA
jgi:hypothetical protein